MDGFHFNLLYYKKIPDNTFTKYHQGRELLAVPPCLNGNSSIPLNSQLTWAIRLSLLNFFNLISLFRGLSIIFSFNFLKKDNLLSYFLFLKNI